jgi:hypothetical protein
VIETLQSLKSFCHRGNQLQTRDKKDVDEMLGHVRGNLNFITYDETISLLLDAGFSKIKHFWKSLLINGFVMEKGI